MSTPRILAPLATLVVAAAALAGCGPSKEDLDLARERVELYNLQHTYVEKADQDCGKVKEQMTAFAAEHKARLDKFNAAWTALPQERRDKARDGLGSGSKKEASDARISITVSCGPDVLLVK